MSDERRPDPWKPDDTERLTRLEERHEGLRSTVLGGFTSSREEMRREFTGIRDEMRRECAVYDGRLEALELKIDALSKKMSEVLGALRWTGTLIGLAAAAAVIWSAWIAPAL